MGEGWELSLGVPKGKVGADKQDVREIAWEAGELPATI